MAPARKPERGSHSSGTTLARCLLQPTRMTGPEKAGTLARTTSSLFGLAPGGVCLATHVAMCAVGSYPTLSPLPAKAGGILSVALSLGSPPPDVIRHRFSVEPGLSSPRNLSVLAERGCPANWQAVHNRRLSQLPVPKTKRRRDGRFYWKQTTKSVSYSGASSWPFSINCAPSRPISSELLAAAPLPPVSTATRSESAKPI